MSTSIKPQSLVNLLAENPSSGLQYAVDVKNLAGEAEKVGDPKVTRALVALMNQHAVIGGAAAHWGGPAAFAEIMASAHAIMFRKAPWYHSYNFVNDAGHAENGIYALRANYGFDGLDFEALRKFRSQESKLTGHGEAHLNPEGVYISNGPLGSGVGPAQGLAMADKITGSKRTTVCAVSDGASMEGETKEAFASIPGLAAKGKLNPFVLLISFNNTKLSGRIDEDSFDMGPTFKSLEVLGWDVRWVENGHDLQDVHAAVEQSIVDAEKNDTRPVAVIFKTIKGFGVESTEKAKSGGHGYPLKAYDDKLPAFIDEIFDGQAPTEFKKWANEILAQKPAPKESTASGGVKSEKVQVGFSKAAIALAKKGLPIFSLSSDLQGSTGIAGFHKEFPELAIDMGVAESNMVSAAIGLSKQGLIPIVDTFAQFGVTKGNLPLTMASLSQAPVIALFSHTGFQDAADGASHQATTYIAATASIPNTTVIGCSCSEEANQYFTQAVERIQEARSKNKTPDSVLFFFGRENHPQYYAEGVSYEWGKAQVLRSGTDGVIATFGPLVAKALAAADQLKEKGKSISVVNIPFINSPDIETMALELEKNSGKLITLEDHQVTGGFGSLLTHALKLKNVDFTLTSLGNKGHFGRSAYKADHLYRLHHMDTEALVSQFS